MYFLAWICSKIVPTWRFVKMAQRWQHFCWHIECTILVWDVFHVLETLDPMELHPLQEYWEEKQLISVRNIIYFTDKKEEDLHIEFNMYVWKLHILFHNVLAPKNNQVTEQVNRAKIRDKINNDSEWIFLQVFISAIANPLQTIICRSHKLCDYDVQPIFQ